ncbi:MAG: ABC transporter substrate-binding protein [Anaerolineales bacterium]|nr:ABC transporter substrate-binding protein [Anaerolineales bacterium]
MKSGRTVLIFSVLLFVLAACGQRAAVPAEEMAMVFMAGYKPQANLPFVGAYVAQEKGFFAEQKLNVEIRHTGGGGEHLQLLAAGEVQVTTQDAAVLLKRRADPGLPLVSIGLLGQRGQQAYAALADSDLETPQDWEGHLVGYKGTPPPDLYALLAAAGADPDAIELVNVGFDPRVLTEGQVAVYPVYKSNEPFLIGSWGYDLVLWDAADYGVPTLGLTYVTSEDILAENPEMLTRFLKAAMQGVEYAAEHPGEAVEIVLQYAGPETDPELMRFMLETELVDAYGEVTDDYGLGWQTLEQWTALADLLVEYDAMAPTDPAAAFTNEILEAANAR